MLLPLTGEVRQKRPDETKLEFTDELYKYIINKEDRNIKKEYVSLDTNNLFSQSFDRTEFIWFYNGTAVSQQRGSISTLYYIRNIVHMRFYGSSLVTYGRYNYLPNNIINPQFNSVDALYEQNTITIGIKELTEQSFQTTEGYKFHFMGSLLNAGDTSLKVISQFYINTKSYSNGYFYFNKPINILNTISIYFGNPFEKLIFPPYFSNFYITYTLNPLNLYIDLYIPSETLSILLVNGLITILNFTTTQPNNFTDNNLINLINQQYLYTYILINVIIDGKQYFIIRKIVPYSGPANYTPIGISSTNVNCIIESYRNIFNIEFSFIDDNQLKNDFNEFGITNLLKRELYFRPERIYKTTKIILNSDYNISSFGSNYFQWNVNDFNQYITKYINTNDVIGNIIGIKFKNFSISSCFQLYPWSWFGNNLKNKSLYIYISEIISNFVNIDWNYQAKGLIIDNLYNQQNLNLIPKVLFEYTNNGYFWLNKIQQNLNTVTLYMRIQKIFIYDNLDYIINDKINFYNLDYFGYWGPPVGYVTDPGCLYITNLNPFFPYSLRFVGNIKVYITNFTTLNPIEDEKIIQTINSKNGIYGRFYKDPVTLGFLFIFPSIPYSSFYNSITVQGNNLEMYMPYFEFQLPIDIYQLKSEDDFIRSEYL